MRPVTVDTGGPGDVFEGALVTWMHTPRGGYGFSMPIDATVVAYGLRPSTIVVIEVTSKSGRVLRRHVRAESLRWRRT